MNAYTIRRELVAQLIERRPDWYASTIIDAARELCDFILETNDAEVIRAARDLADKVKG